MAAVVAATPDKDILHFACHAMPGDVVEPESRLLLAPDPAAGDSGDLSEDRILAELQIRQGSLVNLAACSTAYQEGGSGPLLTGLVPAFLVDGASDVIASLWPLGDRPARIFNSTFYQFLKAGLDPPTALAASQRRAISGALGGAMTDVRNWAAYVDYGA